ncbi:MAG: phosphatase PAP2 family protein, partial [Bacteroidales bacterium]|nr:phosphatase PAP2 family protein [Bacteroidales bacterium]
MEKFGRFRIGIVCLLLLSLQFPVNLFAQEEQTLATGEISGLGEPDSLNNDKATFRFSQLAAPTCMIATGAVLGLERFHGVDDAVRDWTKGVCAGNFWHGDDYLQYLPVVTSWGLGLTGVQSRYSLKERAAMTVTAYASMGVMVLGVKGIVSEKRPDSPARNSFPSGHTATAFMGAELVRIEYGWAWGMAAYGVAAGVGFLRMYNDRHWFNDVLAGAGF